MVLVSSVLGCDSNPHRESTFWPILIYNVRCPVTCATAGPDPVAGRVYKGTDALLPTCATAVPVAGQPAYSQVSSLFREFVVLLSVYDT